MGNLQELKDRLRLRNESSVLKQTIILDEKLSAAVELERTRATQLDAKRELLLTRMKDGDGGDIRLSGETELTTLDLERKAAAIAVEEAEAAAEDVTVVIKFGRLTPDNYDKLLDDNTHDEQFELRDFKRAITLACYRGVESVDGESLEMTWEELTATLSSGERDALQEKVVEYNRAAVVLPFSGRNSGRRKPGGK